MIIQPALMRPEIIRATLREIEAPGTGKTETRRLAWKKVPRRQIVWPDGRESTGLEWRPTTWKRLYDRWAAGERDVRIWVRETFTVGYDYDEEDVPVGDLKPFYAATYGLGRWFDTEMGEWRDQPRWTPSIHMPRRLSRITLEVTDLRLQRLQEISEEDARAEGVQLPVSRNEDGSITPIVEISTRFSPTRYVQGRQDGEPVGAGLKRAWTYRAHFASLWESIHGAGAWEANPEVIAVSFRPHLCNIDQWNKAA